ncbi:MAG: TolC family protein [Gemmataceae bacterium]
MRRFLLLGPAAIALAGCESVPKPAAPPARASVGLASVATPPAGADRDTVTPASASQPTPAPSALPPAGGPLSLADLERIALGHNPTLAQAAAQVEAAQGRAVQARLYPNPIVGYQGDEIGNEGKAGQQGAFLLQQVVTAGKLRLNGAKFGEEVKQAEAAALAQQMRVANSVRMAYYRALAFQEVLRVQKELVKVAEDAVTTTQELINTGAANRPDLLQARIEADQQRVTLQNTQARYEAFWQQLAALLGRPDLPPTALTGDVTRACGPLDLDAVRAGLLADSPEVLFARANVERNRYALAREKVEPVPDLMLRGGAQYDANTRNTFANVQVGVRLPVWDRNQGNVRAAASQLARAEAEVGRVELMLQQRLARVWANYRTAKAVEELYRTKSLPDAKEAYELYVDSFKQRRAAWPQVLIAQRTYFRLATEHLQAAMEVRQAEVLLCGLLEADGLGDPLAPPSEGGRVNKMPNTQANAAMNMMGMPMLQGPLVGGMGRGTQGQTGELPDNPGP